MVRVKVFSGHCLSRHRAYNSLGDVTSPGLSRLITRLTFLARVVVTRQTKPGDPFRRACAAQRFFRWQKFNCRTAAGSVFLDLVGRGKFETIRPVPMQARRVEIIVARKCHRLAASEAAVDFRALEMLTCATISTHICSEAGEILIVNELSTQVVNCGCPNQFFSVLRRRLGPTEKSR